MDQNVTRQSCVPVQREKRRVHHKEPLHFERYNFRWTLADKKKLLCALKKYNFSEVAKIQEHFLPYRSWLEIENFIKRLKIRSNVMRIFPKKKVPMELWTEMANELTAKVTDCSCVLSEAFSQIKDGEAHEVCRRPEDPNWKSIYNYLVVQLKGEELPQVGQIEAAIILDLLESVALDLGSRDISDQRRLIERRYSLLSTRIDAADRTRAFVLACRALEDDLSTSTTVENQVITTANSDQSSIDNAREAAEPVIDTAMECLRKIQEAPLYTINPFCIPIKYLNPKQRHSVTPPIPGSETSNASSV